MFFTGPMDAGAMCMPGAVDKVQRLIDDAVSKGAKVLAGGRIGPANPTPTTSSPSAAAVNGDAQSQQQQPAANGSSTAATPTRVTRRSAAAAAAAADGSSSSSSVGQFYPPTVIVGVTPDMDLYHEEAFGPVSTLKMIMELFMFIDHYVGVFKDFLIAYFVYVSALNTAVTAAAGALVYRL